jgi:hypothetical protein
VVRRRDLHPDAARLPLPGCDQGLGARSWPGDCRIRWDANFCVAALEEAIGRRGKPGLFNTDQGSQFTSFAFTNTLGEATSAISMDGRGRWMDNVFIGCGGHSNMNACS